MFETEQKYASKQSSLKLEKVFSNNRTKITSVRDSMSMACDCGCGGATYPEIDGFYAVSAKHPG
jgi:hypothetical protein